MFYCMYFFIFQMLKSQSGQIQDLAISLRPQKGENKSGKIQSHIQYSPNHSIWGHKNAKVHVQP